MLPINFINNRINYDVIISHGPGCNDGATAAWTVWRTLTKEYREKLEKEGGFYSSSSSYEDDNGSSGSTNESVKYLHPNSPEGAIKLQEKGYPVVFVFIQPSNGVPNELVAGKKVLVLDLDMGDALIPLVDAAAFTFLCDHHDSTPQTLAKHSDFLFETNRHKFGTFININKSECGATLAWTLTHSSFIPPFVQIVRIGDTWMWNDYPDLHSKAVLTSLFMERAFKSFPDIERIFNNWDENFKSYVDKGYAVLEYEKSIVRQIAKQCDLGYIQTKDGTIYTVAYTQANVLHSDVGVSMRWYAEKRFKVPIHFCATWRYVSYKDIISVSLRSPQQGLNLATIARNINGCDGKGGGHPEAAGFSFIGYKNLHKFILKSPPSPIFCNNSIISL